MLTNKMFPVPIIIALSQTTGNEMIVNAVSFNAQTYTIDLPVIGTHNGPFRLAHVYTVNYDHVIFCYISHLYIIVALTENVATGVKNISTQELLKQSTSTFPLFYITAVVNASQFVPGRRMMYILGAGDDTTDAEDYVFHNREVEIGFTYFFRVFSVNSTSEVLPFLPIQTSYMCIVV